MMTAAHAAAEAPRLTEAWRLVGAGQFDAADVLLREQPPSAATCDLRARIALQQRRYADAAALAEAATASAPASADAWYTLGRAVRALGENDRAEKAYRKVLDIDGVHADALVSLAVVLNERRAHDEAEPLLRRATALRPDQAAAWHNLAVALDGLGRQPEAAVACRRVLAMSPRVPSAWLLLARLLDDGRPDGESLACIRQAAALDPGIGDALLAAALHGETRHGSIEQQMRFAAAAQGANAGALIDYAGALLESGDAAGALRSADWALHADPTRAEGHNARAIALNALGRTSDAIAAARNAIALAPDFVEAKSNLGALLREAGDLPASRAVLREALALAPDCVAALVNLGLTARAEDQVAEAIDCFKLALRFAPNHAEAWNNLGLALLWERRWPEAEQAFEHAAVLDPAMAEPLVNLGSASLDRGRFHGALGWFERALAIDPASPEANANLGVALMALQRLPEAEAAFERALALRPELYSARLSRGIARLMQGELDAGWQDFEWRWHANPRMRHLRDRFTVPRWQGEPAGGRTLLLHAEQGLGDAIQFVRYAPLLARKGFHVIVEAHAPLRRLVGRMPGVRQVVAFGEALPAHELHCPLMSVPGVLGGGLAAVPAEVPYFDAPPAMARAWRERFAALEGLKVGLVWSGDLRPDDRNANVVDARRSMRAALYAPLAGIPGISLVSLQKGAPATQLRDCMLGAHVLDPTDDFGDFLDTAAAVQALDLVISVDTSVVHLAGALGKPVWMLSRYDGCWRWMLDRDDSPWYPTLRIFRQAEPMAWQPVVERVAAELRALAARVSA
jgi:tetratricopeptide (TPR) repeat protein